MGSPVTAYVGLRVEKRLVTPLVTVTEAARSIASGDLGGRASGQGSFGEADHLIEFQPHGRMVAAGGEGAEVLEFRDPHELRTPLTILRGRMQGLADVSSAQSGAVPEP